MTLPAEYAWIEKVGLLPRMLQAAIADIGVTEVAGDGDNPVIMGWADQLGIAVTGYKYTHDSVPWCGLGMAHWAQVAQKPIPNGPLYALNWSTFGDPAGQPCLGDVLVFVRPGGGHVALYVGEDPGAYHVLGANQGDRVCFTRIEKQRLHAARRPPMKVEPASRSPHFLESDGHLSTNET